MLTNSLKSCSKFSLKAYHSTSKLMNLFKNLDSMVATVSHNYPIAVETGQLNSLIPLPSVPNIVINSPFSSNTLTLSFNASQTIRCPALLTNKQRGVLNSPSPFPFFPNL